MPRRYHPVSPGRFSASRKPASFEELKTAYLHHLALRNLSTLTIGQNEQAIRFFAAFLEHERIRSVLDVNAGSLEQYKAELAAYRTRKGMSLRPGTLRARVFIIQGWFRWLAKKGFVPYDPVASVKAPRRAKHLPKGVMSVEEVKKIMSQPDIYQFPEPASSTTALQLRVIHERQ